MNLATALNDAKPEIQNAKKVVRILVYPNITFQENLEKDSFVQVIKNQIKELNEIRDDLWFYVIQPYLLTSTLKSCRRRII